MARFWVCLAGAGFFLGFLVLHSRLCISPVSWAVKKYLSGVWIALLRGDAAVVGWRWRALAPALACLFQKPSRRRNCRCLVLSLNLKKSLCMRSRHFPVFFLSLDLTTSSSNLRICIVIALVFRLRNPFLPNHFCPAVSTALCQLSRHA